MRQEIRFTTLIRLQQHRRVAKGNFNGPVVFCLRMDSAAPASVSNRRKGIRVWVFIAVACLVAVVVAIIPSNSPNSSNNTAPEPNLVWLDQSQFARPMQPGRLKRLYYKVVNLGAPLWQHFRGSKTNILINFKVLAVHGLSTGNLGIGAATATNQTGTQIWILSPSELADLRQQLKTAHGIDVVNSPSLTDADGMSATIFVGQALPQTSASVGVMIDVNPKIAYRQFQLVMNALYTEPTDSPTIPIRTNLSAACRVILSNAGGALISSPASRDPNGTNYWLILDSTAIDRTGKPVKL